MTTTNSHFLSSSSAASSTLAKVLSRWTVKNSWKSVEYIQRDSYTYTNVHTRVKKHATVPCSNPPKIQMIFEKPLSGSFSFMLICVPWLIQYGLRSSGIFRITSTKKEGRGLSEEIHTKINPSQKDFCCHFWKCSKVQRGYKMSRTICCFWLNTLTRWIQRKHCSHQPWRWCR